MSLMGMELPLQAIRRQIASGIDLIVYLGRLRDKTRRLLEITEVTGMEGDQVGLKPLFLFRETGEVSGRICGIQERTGEMKHIEKFQRAGIGKMYMEAAAGNTDRDPAGGSTCLAVL